MTNPVRILILDDEPRIRQMIAMFLEDFDEFDVVAMHTAEEALEDIEKSPAHICIVDMRLPDMNGHEFIRLAKEKSPDAHFLIHTGSVEISEMVSKMGIGITPEDVFLKPADLETLLARIKQLCQEN